jgi:signal transduction histidine kinase
LLDINAIESGNMNLSVQRINVALFVRQCTQEYAERAQAKSITLHSAIAGDVLEGYADPNALMEILDNLVSNAVKYSPAGKNVWVSLVSNLPEASSLTIAVKDEGPGMTDEDKQRLFGKFARLSAQPTGGESSTGLGLSIVKKMVEAMRGRVWCESTLGAGATFFVELPTEPFDVAAEYMQRPTP